MKHMLNVNAHTSAGANAGAKAIATATANNTSLHANTRHAARAVAQQVEQEPVCGHASLQAVLAHTRQGPITVRQWLRDVRQLLAQLPAGCGHIVNICEDRYHFLLGFGACLLGGKVSLQLSSLTPAAWAQVAQQAPDAVCLHDGHVPEELGEEAGPALPCLHVGDIGLGGRGPGAANHAAGTALADDARIPVIAATQVVAQVFTSGSTGTPVGHAKTWGKLCRNVRAGAQLLGLVTGRGHAPESTLDPAPALGKAPWCLVGTVPSQHMYGFESVILQALIAGHSLWHARPFYPADVAEALAAVPQPRMLVSTPVHLKVLVESGVALPAVDRVLCATAPLAGELAQRVEAALQAPLFEIYGSTETGQMAVRQPVQGPQWTLFPGVALEADESGQVMASGGHLEGRIPLSDQIERVDAQRFVLHGRSADMVNIAGKRSSLAHLNSVLARISAIQDGAFFLPDDGGHADGHAGAAPMAASAGGQPAVQRLCLVACAPGLTADAVMRLLRQHIDDVFLPRPLILLDQLPRNATGKLPQAALQAIYAQHMARARAHAAAKARTDEAEKAGAHAPPATSPAGAEPSATALLAETQPASREIVEGGAEGAIAEGATAEAAAGRAAHAAVPASAPSRAAGVAAASAAADLSASQRWQVPAQHPAFAGHFPGHPVLPGAVLLQQCLDLCRARCQALAPDHGQRGWVVQSAKFLRTCHPGDELLLQVEPQSVPAAASNAAVDGSVAWAFRVLRGQDTVMSGVAQAVAAPQG